MPTDTILVDLKTNGHRLTRIRKAIVRLLSGAECPMSASDLKSALEKNMIKANKTTVYRQAAFLLKNGVIHEIQFGDGKTRYRICPENHHHHTICVRCSRVEDISMEKDMERYEKKLVQIKNFRVLRHTLEFFGICGNCSNGEMKT